MHRATKVSPETPAAVSASAAGRMEKRRGSELMVEFVKSDKMERKASTSQMKFSNTLKKFVSSDALVPRGCVSAELGDAMVAAVLGVGDEEVDKDAPLLQEDVMKLLFLFLLFPPIFCGILFGMWPISSPTDGFIRSGYASLEVLVVHLGFAGAGYMCSWH